AALGDDFTDALRLSRDQARRLQLLRHWAESPAQAGELGYRLGVQDGIAAIVLRAALMEMPPDPDADRSIREGAEQVLPLAAADLMPRWQGAALGATLRRLEQDWIASGFTLTRDALLARADAPERG
ncbi:MAG: CCA tRNA nucleotidyltransferase, partial [Proteobacteria bacterium]|nr:CCA tRNA nucleotidyltransferase [Pseudomonadota bacterium]